MYGTVAHLYVKPGMEADFHDWMRLEVGEYAAVPGLIDVHLYKLDRGEHHWIMVVLFADKTAYIANAQRPEQHAIYLQMRRCLVSDPEWHDGEIAYTTQR
jgi:quinol monooxygenase YgiN